MCSITFTSSKEASCSGTGSFVWPVSVFWCHAFPPRKKHVSSQYQRVLKQVFFFTLSLPFLWSLFFSRPCTYDGRTRYASVFLFLITSLLGLGFQCGVAVEYIWKCMVLYTLWSYCPDFSTKPKRSNYTFDQSSVKMIWRVDLMKQEICFELKLTRDIPAFRCAKASFISVYHIN